MKEEVKKYKEELEQELENILAYWMHHAIDNGEGGFYGKIDSNNIVYADAPKGSVLNSRILWTFSAAYNLTKNEQYLTIADRAYHYLTNFFIDKDYGGVYWTVDYKGEPLDTKKQMYAQAFAIYALSKYYQSKPSDEVKALAIDLYNVIEKHSHDAVNKGYIEALSRDWQELDDLRLSSKDANEKKTMNTHLHILESYANLYRIWPNEQLKQNIIELINIFFDYIINKETNHLMLFFDDNWNVKSNIISYGHDIEAAWLIQEAAEIIHEEDLIQKVKECSVKLAEAAATGLDNDGGLWYEKEVAENHLVKEKHWWPQAEAMVGFYNTWQITGDERFLQQSLSTWRFVQKYILDKQRGEWFWGVREDYSVMDEDDKIGLWKCPYHNGRACIEIVSRISTNANAYKNNQ